jgi:hypothetical protein
LGARVRSRNSGKSFEKTRLEGRRNAYEEEVIERLSTALPEDVRLTRLADRGFGDQKRYMHLKLLGWDYVIRFRDCILVTDSAGTTSPASDWLNKTGRAKMLKGPASPTTRPRFRPSDRRDRLLFLGAIAHALLTLLGAAGERCGLDRTLKVNTVERRTLSLYEQGCFWYA